MCKLNMEISLLLIISIIITFAIPKLSYAFHQDDIKNLKLEFPKRSKAKNLIGANLSFNSSTIEEKNVYTNLNDLELNDYNAEFVAGKSDHTVVIIVSIVAVILVGVLLFSIKDKDDATWWDKNKPPEY